ncbi:hypothetical protein [Actinomadura sp. KC06]|nr:hypothetical protein [Actinomadura sp. KC06]
MARGFDEEREVPAWFGKARTHARARAGTRIGARVRRRKDPPSHSKS